MNGPEGRSWRRFRPKFTLGRMMIAVALVAVLLLVVRGEGSPEAGAVLVVASVVTLGGKLAADAMARGRAAGRTIDLTRKAVAVVGGMMCAAAIIGLADFAFLYLYAFVDNGFHGQHPSRQLSIASLMASLVAVVLAISLLRRVARIIWAALNRGKAAGLLGDVRAIEREESPGGRR